MKLANKFVISLLALVMVFLAGSQTVSAADEEYTYTVRLYAGNQGKLSKGGVEVSSSSAKVSSAKDEITISGLKYGDTVYINPQDAADITDERYYVKGVRRSGRDNSEAEAPTFHVACDRDYVVAYGVAGDMVEYTVHYVDANGSPVRDSDTYYGNIGDRQYVSSRYVDGYQPQALNMVKTLSANAAENVFTFRYTKVTAPPTNTQTPTPAPAQNPAPGGTTPGGTAGGTAGTAGAGTADANAPAADDGAAAQDQGENLPDGDVPLGGDAGVELPDGDVPLDQKELVDLDDEEEVPLASLNAEQPTVMGYLPVYIGIAAAAVLALGAAAIYLKRSYRVVVEKRDGKEHGKKSGQDKK